MKWYLAGPMSNIPQHNIPAFDEAAEKLRSHGYDITSPAELDSDEVREALLASDGDVRDFSHIESFGSVIGRDIQIIMDDIDGIIFLPDWQKSAGARLEAYVGLMAEKRFALYHKGSFTPLARMIVKTHLIGGLNVS